MQGCTRFDNALWDVNLDPLSMLVYLCLKTHANRDGICWPKQRRIAEMVGSSTRSVRQCVANLKAAGLVRVEKKSRTAIYQVIDPVEASAPPEIPEAQFLTEDPVRKQASYLLGSTVPNTSKPLPVNQEAAGGGGEEKDQESASRGRSPGSGIGRPKPGTPITNRRATRLRDLGPDADPAAIDFDQLDLSGVRKSDLDPARLLVYEIAASRKFLIDELSLRLPSQRRRAQRLAEQMGLDCRQIGLRKIVDTIKGMEDVRSRIGFVESEVRIALEDHRSSSHVA